VHAKAELLVAVATLRSCKSKCETGTTTRASRLCEGRQVLVPMFLTYRRQLAKLFFFSLVYVWKRFQIELLNLLHTLVVADLEVGVDLK